MLEHQLPQEYATTIVNGAFGIIWKFSLKEKSKITRKTPI
jgi:hypothetical protein